MRLQPILFAILLATSAGAASPPEARSPSVPILVYHRFDPVEARSMTVTMPVFEAQLRWLADHHHPVVPLQAVIDSLAGIGPAVAPGSVAITADDGHRSVHDLMFPVVRRLGIPVTLFIYPSAISNASYAMTWEQLAEMQRSGLIDVESHTYWHPDFHAERARRTDADYEAFAEHQLAASRRALERRLGRPVTLLAWPWGVSDPVLLRLAAATGYQAAFALGERPARPADPLYALPRILVSDHDRGSGLEARFREAGLESAR